MIPQNPDLPDTNQEENLGTELEVIGEIPPLGNAPDSAVY